MTVIPMNNLLQPSLHAFPYLKNEGSNCLFHEAGLRTEQLKIQRTLGECLPYTKQLTVITHRETLWEKN